MVTVSNPSDLNAKPELNGIGYSELALVHTTSYRPSLDEDGCLEIRSSFEGGGGFNQKPDASIEDSKSPFGIGMRPTVHFSLQEPVSDHAYGSFEGRDYTVYAPLKLAVERNGAPETVMSADTSFFAPEASVKLPLAVLVKVDTDKELPVSIFAQNKDGMLVVAQELNDSNRASAIALLRTAEYKNPLLGAAEMAVYAETALGPRASVEVSKALALNQIGAPTLNRAIDFKYESNLGFDGWADHENTQQFVRDLPLPKLTCEHIHVGRHDGSLADKLNSAFRRGNISELEAVASAGQHPAIVDFAVKLKNSELMSNVRGGLILQELANKDHKIYDSFGASSNGIVRTIYVAGRSFESEKLGTIDPSEVDIALTRASDEQLNLISAALLSRDVNGPEGNKGDQILFDQIESARQMNAITREFMPTGVKAVQVSRPYAVVRIDSVDTAAFSDVGFSVEVGRIIHDMCAALKEGLPQDPIPLSDTNGNVVGAFSMEVDQPTPSGMTAGVVISIDSSLFAEETRHSSVVHAFENASKMVLNNGDATLSSDFSVKTELGTVGRAVVMQAAEPVLKPLVEDSAYEP